MCGLWGFIGDEPDPRLLEDVIRAAATRGPHAWGVARAAGWGMERIVSVGALADEVTAAVALCAESPWFVGHSRLATSGYASRSREEDVQPLVAGRTALAHNGTVRNAADFGVDLTTTNDSEALAQRIAASSGDFGVRVLAAMELLPAVPHALIAVESGALVAARRDGKLSEALRAGRQGAARGHPLFWWSRPDGTYLCSRQAWPEMREVEGVMTFRAMADA